MKTYHGIIFSGLGVAGILIQQNAEVYKQKCGFDLYPGTLNITLSENFVFPEKVIFIDAKEIKFAYMKLDIYLIPATFRHDNVIIMVPDPSFYDKNVIEVMATENLKEKYNLKDGDEVEIQL